MLAHTSCSCAKSFHSQPQGSSLLFYSLECRTHTHSPTRALPISLITNYYKNIHLQCARARRRTSTQLEQGAPLINPFVGLFDLRQLWWCVRISMQPKGGEWVMTGADKRAVNISWHKINQTPTPSSSSPLGLGFSGVRLPGNTDWETPTSQCSFFKSTYGIGSVGGSKAVS